MSNESKSGNMNDQGGLEKNDPNRISGQPKSGQQSQGGAPQTDKSATQQGGSMPTSGQQSQGASQKNSDEMKRTGSSNVSSDQKTGNEAGQPAGSPK